ncbi:MAG TPA: arginine--tRNA ligase [Candidatus Paceibacterota bacterium]
MMGDILSNHISEVLKEQGFPIPAYIVEHPADLSHGDYTTNVVLILAKEIGKDPQELAQKIVHALEQKKIEEVAKISIAGAGFINFYFLQSFFVRNIFEILQKEETWGSNTSLVGEKIMIEHSQPNPFKPFHIGHLMSNTIGESISRLMRFSGADVRAVNYQGDVGLHVAKAMWGIRDLNLNPQSIEDLGKAYVHGNTQYEDSEIAKAEIIELNKKIYKHDPAIQDMYEVGRDTSLKHFDELYEILGSRFDHLFFEGDVWETGKALVGEGKEKGIFEESEGATVFHGEPYGLHTRVFITAADIPTYEAKDLGLIEAKRDFFPFDTSITVTAVEQEQYFNTVFKAYELLRPKRKGALVHIAHGMMQLSSGKMSSRRGNIITGESLLQDVQDRAQSLIKESSKENAHEIVDAVAVGAIKYSILKQAVRKNISFDPEKSLSFEGDSGPYLQYTCARAHTLLEKAGTKKEKEVGSPPPHTGDIERLVYRFPEVVLRAQTEYEPHYLVTYLTLLAGVFNSWYAKEKILDGGPEEAYKLAITRAVMVTLKNGLWLLGIKAPTKM